MLLDIYSPSPSPKTTETTAAMKVTIVKIIDRHVPLPPEGCVLFINSPEMPATMATTPTQTPPIPPQSVHVEDGPREQG